MKYYIFKYPRRKDDKPVAEYNYDPTSIIDTIVAKFGSIIIKTSEELKEMQ